MLKVNTKTLSKNYLILPICIVTCIFFLLLDSIGVLNNFRNVISFLFEPVYANATGIGTNVRNSVRIIVKISELQKDYNELKISSYESDINNSYYKLLEEENEALRMQISLGNKENEYLVAKVLGSSGGSDSLNIAVGTNDGVAINDVVSLGNMYVGQVANADSNGSLVRLASSRNSNFEVIITSVGVENGSISESPLVLSRGVASGTADGIRVENISTTADITDGCVVVINDAKVGDYLVLGYLVGLTNNPAETSRSGYVSTIIDYDDLKSVFVRID